jgi:predicted nucleic acid-binding protein
VSPPGVEAVLVDTDVFSYLMNGRGYAYLYRPHVEGKLMAISFITVGELYFGAYKRKWGNDKLGDLKDRLRSATIVPFDEGVCKKYAEIKAAMESKGKSIGLTTCGSLLVLCGTQFPLCQTTPNILLRYLDWFSGPSPGRCVRCSPRCPSRQKQLSLLPPSPSKSSS